MKRLTAYMPMSVPRRYSRLEEFNNKVRNNNEDGTAEEEEEEAPSTAQELRKMLEANARQGLLANRTVEKALEAFQEAMVETNPPDPIKN